MYKLQKQTLGHDIRGKIIFHGLIPVLLRNWYIHKNMCFSVYLEQFVTYIHYSIGVNARKDRKNISSTFFFIMERHLFELLKP